MIPFHFCFKGTSAWALHLMVALVVLSQKMFVRVKANRARISIVTTNKKKISSFCKVLLHNSHFETSLGLEVDRSNLYQPNLRTGFTFRCRA